MLFFRLFLRVCGGQPEGEIRLAVMAGGAIYANVRLRLAANRTYGLRAFLGLFHLYISPASYY